MAQISNDLWSKFHRATTLNQENHHVSYCMYYVQMMFLLIEMLADTNFLKAGCTKQVSIFLIYLLMLNELAQ